MCVIKKKHCYVSILARLMRNPVRSFWVGSLFIFWSSPNNGGLMGTLKKGLILARGPRSSYLVLSSWLSFPSIALARAPGAHQVGGCIRTSLCPCWMGHRTCSKAHRPRLSVPRTMGHPHTCPPPRPCHPRLQFAPTLQNPRPFYS